MTLLRFILLLISLGLITTSGQSYFTQSEMEGDWVCCENNDECANAGGVCCDYSASGVEPCGMGAPGYCRTACTVMN